MIVSYETLRTLTVHLAGASIGLLLCDEGHRLKNSGKTFPIDDVNFRLTVIRRITHFCCIERSERETSCHPVRYAHPGTFPVFHFKTITQLLRQNDLSEYFSLLNFANPNFLGSKNDFRKNFENAIIRGRDADATDAVKAESEKKLKELGGLVTKFIIRRTNDLLSKYRMSLSLNIGVLLTSHNLSARQIRTSRLLSPVQLPIGVVSTVHQVSRNTSSSSRPRFTTTESHQYPEETLQPPRTA